MRSSLLRLTTLVLALTFAVGACDDGTGPEPLAPRPVGVVLNSVDNSLTVFPVTAPDSVITIGLGADGTPVGFAVEGSRAVVPLGLTPAVAVVDLQQGALARTIGLPEGSGATGIALFGTDSALVANPQLNSVSVVDLAAGTRSLEIDVGPYPQAIVAEGGFAYVVNRHLGDDFQPTGPATVSVVDLASLSVMETIQLSGTNPGSALLEDDRLYVLHAGSWGSNNGSLSVVDTDTRTEAQHLEGFGNFPGSLTLGPDGDLYIASFSYGIAIWDPASASFERSPDDALQPDGLTTVSDVGFDGEGRLYTLRPFCAEGEPDIAYRLTSDFEVDRTIAVGNCPMDIAFTEIEQTD